MGFGSLQLTGSFWFGLHAMHCLTSQGQWELRVDYKFPNGTMGYLSYSKFRVGPASEQYQLTYSGFTGYTNDPMSGRYSAWDMKFTTRDRDNDLAHSYNCAREPVTRAGGWWYRDCSHFNPNMYKHNYSINLGRKNYPLSYIEMKIRPINCLIK